MDKPITDHAADFMVFVLADMRFAVELARVREVTRAVFITPLPAAPEVVEGIIDVRGTTVPVYDLRLRFGLPARRLDINDHILIAWTGEHVVAVRCEKTDVLTGLLPASIDEAEHLQHGGRVVAGVVRQPDGLILIHDLKHFLDDVEDAALQAALSDVR